MSDKQESISGISIDITKELSNQLQQLYGFASTDILPIIMHAIRMNSLFNIIGTICAIIFTIFYIKKFVIDYSIPKMKEIGENDRYYDYEKIFCLWVFNIASTIILFFVVDCTISNICYVVSPETKLIYKLLLGKL